MWLLLKSPISPNGTRRGVSKHTILNLVVDKTFVGRPHRGKLWERNWALTPKSSWWRVRHLDEERMVVLMGSSGKKGRETESHWGLNRVMPHRSANSHRGPWFIMFLIKKAIASPWWTQVDEWQASRAALNSQPRQSFGLFYKPSVRFALNHGVAWNPSGSLRMGHLLHPHPLPTELHQPSYPLALNRSLLLYGVITFLSLWQLWGFLIERIRSMSPLSKKPQKTQHKPNQTKTPKGDKKEICIGGKWTKVSHAEEQAALQPSLCQCNQKGFYFFVRECISALKKGK